MRCTTTRCSCRRPANFLLTGASGPAPSPGERHGGRPPQLNAGVRPIGHVRLRLREVRAQAAIMAKGESCSLAIAPHFDWLRRLRSCGEPVLVPASTLWNLTTGQRFDRESSSCDLVSFWIFGLSHTGSRSGRAATVRVALPAVALGCRHYSILHSHVEGRDQAVEMQRTLSDRRPNYALNLTVRPVTRLAVAAQPRISSNGGGQGAYPPRPAG